MKDSNGIQYLLTDHLGSVSAVVNDSGTLLSEQRYLPFGGIRDDVTGISETDFGYTGQRDNAGIGMMDYNARWYAPSTGRFTATDTIVPNMYDP